MYVCMSACMHACMHACIYIYIYMYNDTMPAAACICVDIYCTLNMFCFTPREQAIYHPGNESLGGNLKSSRIRVLPDSVPPYLASISSNVISTKTS